MTRGRPRKAEDLTESWDDVADSDHYDDDIFTRKEEKKELGSQYLSSQGTADVQSSDDERLTRSTRSMKKSVRLTEPERKTSGPELIMPLAPNGGDAVTTSKIRAQTPHFRLNQRSLTSDAGFLQRKAEAERRSHEKDASVWYIVQPILAWASDILRIAVNNSLVKYALALWLIIGAALIAKNFATNTVSTALSPLCRLPVVSNLPFCESYTYAAVQGNAEFDKLMQAQAQFEEVLSTSAKGATLPLDMKRSEASIRDVRQVVAHSSLPSKNELVFEFGGFIELARTTGHNLAKFNIRIGHAVDRILSTNRWTLQVIEGVVEKDAGTSSLARVIDSINILAPFQPMALQRGVLVDQYLKHTSAIEEQISSLIDYAQTLLSALDDLDARLDVIASIVTRDGITVEGNKDALFATLWTKLGGNRGSVAKLEKQLELLREVGQYRRLAWAHISGTIVKLQAIQLQLEDLRERVALPEVLGDKVPLEVHIENINLGIERLESERDTSRRISDEATGRWQAKVGQMIDVSTLRHG